MDVNGRTTPDSGIGTLMSGIVGDVQDLIKQQASLFKHELRADVRHIMQAALGLVVGATVLLVGLILLCFMLVYLINWLAPGIPLWACYGIIGGAAIIIGLAVVLMGRDKLRSNLVPRESLASLKENLEWTRKPR